MFEDGLDVVTAFIPKHPHHIIQPRRLGALRWDDERLRGLRTSAPGSKAGVRAGENGSAEPCAGVVELPQQLQGRLYQRREGARRRQAGRRSHSRR
jgi:hypothetical protein